MTPEEFEVICRLREENKQLRAEVERLKAALAAAERERDGSPLHRRGGTMSIDDVTNYPCTRNEADCDWYRDAHRERVREVEKLTAALQAAELGTAEQIAALCDKHRLERGEWVAERIRAGQWKKI